MDLGRLAADEVLRAHLQTHGEPPRGVVIDLWGSATLRTGGEEIAQGFALIGCRPIWDRGTGRVTGVEVLPTAAIGRARVDVTWRISGLFRDLFPAQIALINAAVQAVAARDEDDDESPLPRVPRRRRARLQRIFGTAPGTYGSGVEDLLGRDTRQRSDRCSVPCRRPRTAMAAPKATAARRPMPSRSVSPARTSSSMRATIQRVTYSRARGCRLSSAVFAAAAKLLGRAADLVMLDVTDPQRPRARTLSAALARIVRGRAINPRFIAGQMRHGPRGAAELAETVDRLVAFAETTDAVASELFDLLHAAYVADPDVHAFLLRENPQAAAAHRRAVRRRAAAWLLASAAQRCRCRPRGAARGGGSMTRACRINRSAAPRRLSRIVGADADRRRIAGPAACRSAQFRLPHSQHLCAAARRHGNGIIEVTSRGSIQVRGLNAASAPRFADAIAALGIAAEDGIPVLSNALAGLDAKEIFDASAARGRFASCAGANVTRREACT